MNRFRNRSVFPLLCCLPLSGIALPVFAQNVPPAQKPAPDVEAIGEKRFPFKTQNVTLKAALDALFKQAGATYKIAPDVPEAAVQGNFSLSLDGFTFDQMLQYVLRMGSGFGQTPLTYKVEKGVYTIVRDPNPQPQQGFVLQLGGEMLNQLGGEMQNFRNNFRRNFRFGMNGMDRGYPLLGGGGGTAFPRTELSSLKKRVSFEAKGSRVGEILKSLFTQADVNYVAVVEDAAPPVTLAMSNVPLEAAVLSVVRSVEGGSGLTFSVEQGIAVVGAEQPPVFSAEAPLAANLRSRRVSLRLKETDLREALRILFGTVQVRYTLSRETRSVPVTLTLDDVPFQKALDSLLDSTKIGLDYQIEDNVFRIVPGVGAKPNKDI